MRIALLDHGFVDLKTVWGSDEEIIESARPPDSEYWRSILLAIERGYRINPETGEIFGLKGQLLSGKKSKNQDYPTVRFYVAGLSRGDYTIPIHKAIAYTIWGWAAFADGVEVRHLDGNTENNKKSNLALGDSSANQMDKPASVRSAAAKKARSRQPIESYSAILTDAKAAEILNVINGSRVPSGRVPRGVVKMLAEKYGVSPSAISLIGKGKTWTR